MPPQLRLGGCRRCEIRECTPEEGKSKSLRGELPLRDKESHPGKWKSKLLRGELPLQDKGNHSGRRRKQVIPRCSPHPTRKRPLA